MPNQKRNRHLVSIKKALNAHRHEASLRIVDNPHSAVANPSRKLVCFNLLSFCD